MPLLLPRPTFSMLSPFRPPTVLTNWSEWVPLREAGRNKTVPSHPGLYRIRRVGFDGLDYVGQTGGKLRTRLGMLSGIFRDEMPYRDPHTAGPALWALRHSEGCEFEAGTTMFTGTSPERQGLEALAISLYRIEHGGSPTANFGRIPAGYRGSSGNNSRLVAAGKRFRGGPVREPIAITTSVPVHGNLESDVLAPDWMGWRWSPWEAATHYSAAAPLGLYRLMLKGGSAPLIYIGEGQIGSRIRAHLAKARNTGHRQAHFFSQTLDVSWVEVKGLAVHRWEHENDLIASHVLTTGEPPVAQFLG